MPPRPDNDGTEAEWADDEATADPDAPQECDLEAFSDDRTPTNPCPKCGDDMPDFADRCPYCGEWVVQGGERRATRSVVIMIVVVALLVAALLVWAL